MSTKLHEVSSKKPSLKKVKSDKVKASEKPHLKAFFYSSSFIKTDNGEQKEQVKIERNEDKIKGVYDKIVNGKLVKHEKITNKNIQKILK